MKNGNINNIGQIVKAKTNLTLSPSSSLAHRDLQELISLRTDPEVSKPVSLVRYGNSWETRCEAWQKLRNIGPERNGWADALKELIYSSDGWGRIFAAESLSCYSSSAEDAIPVLVATIEASIENHSFDWARVACGAIEKYQNLKPSLMEMTISALLLALDCQDYNVSGYAIRALSRFGKDALAAIPRIIAVASSMEDEIKDIFWSFLRNFHPSIQDPVDALILATTSSDPKVRGEAVCEIVKFRDASYKAIPQLLMLAADESSDVRRFLGFTLGKLGKRDSRVINVVRVLFHDNEASVRLAASLCMSEIVCKSTLEP